MLLYNCLEFQLAELSSLKKKVVGWALWGTKWNPFSMNHAPEGQEAQGKQTSTTHTKFWPSGEFPFARAAYQQ